MKELIKSFSYWISVILVSVLFQGSFAEKYQAKGLPCDKIVALGSLGICLFAATEQGVFRSYDQGNQWTRSNSDLPTEAITAFGIMDSVLYAGFCGKIFRSGDSGNSWVSVSHGINPMDRIKTFAFLERDLFTVSGDQIYRLGDHGETWAAAGFGLPGFILSVAAKGPDLFAYTNFDGVFRSGDHGNSWEPAKNGLPSWNQFCSPSLAASDTGVFAWSFYNGAYGSLDNGQNWLPITLPVSQNLHEFYVAPNGIYAAFKDSVYYSPGPFGLWTLFSLESPAITSFALMGNDLFGGTDNQGVFVYLQKENKWAPVHGNQIFTAQTKKEPERFMQTTIPAGQKDSKTISPSQKGQSIPQWRSFPGSRMDRIFFQKEIWFISGVLTLFVVGLLQNSLR